MENNQRKSNGGSCLGFIGIIIFMLFILGSCANCSSCSCSSNSDDMYNCKYCGAEMEVPWSYKDGYVCYFCHKKYYD